MKLKGIYHMPGSKFFWYRWQENGKRHAVSLKTEELPLAIKKAEEIKSGRTIVQWASPTPAPITLATKAVETYLQSAMRRAKKPMRSRTANKQKAVLLKFLNECHIGDTRQIDCRVATRWIGQIKGSADTRHTYARVLRTFLLFLATNGGIVREMSNIEIPERSATGRKNWLKLDAANDIITKSQDPDLTFVLFAGFHCGLRKSEIVNARVGWFDMEAGLLHVQNDQDSGFVLKDRENRTVPLTENFHHFLLGFLGKRDAAEYCIAPDARGKGEYRYDFKRAINSHFKRHGVVCSTHDMRRSFASNLVSHGVSIYKVARWLGDGVQVVERSYGHLAPADKDVDVLSSSSGHPHPSQ